MHNEWMGRSNAQKSSKVSVGSEGQVGVEPSGLHAYLGIMSVQRVDFEVLFLNISLEMEDRWWMRRRSTVVKARHCG